MKLCEIEIEKLYGYYNYHVIFNSDVTFLFGVNGCGKTTILNITESIITGRLYDLFEYDFKKIILTYYQKSEKDLKKIQITRKDSVLQIEFGDSYYTLKEDIDFEDDDEYPFSIDSSEITKKDKQLKYFRKYDFLQKIWNEFEYIYLPLDRSSFDHKKSYYSKRVYRRKITIEGTMFNSRKKSDPIIQNVEDLIYEYYAKTSMQIEKHSEDFRNEILSSLIKVNKEIDTTKLLKDFFKQKQENIEDIKITENTYIKLLEELDIINDDELTKYREFFKDFIEELKNTNDTRNESITINMLLKTQENSKINELVNIADDMEQKKAKEREQIDLFLKIMNEFIESSDDGKKIEISKGGQVFFTTKFDREKPISIQHFSSGEKQIITFFANLLFNFKKDTAGIFVIDEPELSLHLAWQKIFVDKIFEVNKNIQLIFATHSPEFVGKKALKMYELVKQYSGKE